MLAKAFINQYCKCSKNYLYSIRMKRNQHFLTQLFIKSAFKDLDNTEEDDEIESGVSEHEPSSDEEVHFIQRLEYTLRKTTTKYNLI